MKSSDQRQASLDFGEPEPQAPSAASKPAPPAPGSTRLPPAPVRGHARRATAESMAERQRDISVSEFFSKNRHLLGFDNPQKALLTAVKEAVDNSLDACEEAGILPDLLIEIRQLSETRFVMGVEDNGPGIVKAQIPKIFGKLLYGSKFHTLKQSRGQQGIGISAAGMYGQLTSGKPTRIWSRTGPDKPAHHYEIRIDTRKNAPAVVRDEKVDWARPHGTRVEIEMEGTFKKGRRSVDDYVQQTALANPHASIRYTNPAGEEVVYERAALELPVEPREIRPHPYGVELGMLHRIIHESSAGSLRSALQREFSRVSEKVSTEILGKAGLSGELRPRNVSMVDAEGLMRAVQQVKIMAPPTTCLSPIGEELILSGMRARLKADFYTSTSRPPAVYRGNPFQIEVGLAYGGELPAEEPMELFRVANRAPLQYQQSACAIFRAALTTDWRNYGLQQPKGSLPVGPVALFVHMASVWVPFTSESKEAIAHYPEIIREMRLGIQECARRLASHVRHRRRQVEESKKRSYIEKFIPHIGVALQEILALTDRQQREVVVVLTDTLQRSRG
ncbi:MAG: DNA topoisomerase VI subunit B [Acidobacteriota bacterium]